MTTLTGRATLRRLATLRAKPGKNTYGIFDTFEAEEGRHT